MKHFQYLFFIMVLVAINSSTHRVECRTTSRNSKIILNVPVQKAVEYNDIYKITGEDGKIYTLPKHGHSCKLLRIRADRNAT